MLGLCLRHRCPELLARSVMEEIQRKQATAANLFKVECEPCFDQLATYC
jgi:hypothetical protein